MDVKKVMAIFIVVALVIIVVAVAVASTQNKDQTNGEYNYSVTYSESFTSISGLTVYALDGRTFAITEVTVKNDSYGAGIKTNALILHWKYTIDRVTYGVNEIRTAEHPNYWSDTTIEKGRSWTYTVVFEIDKNAVGKLDRNLTYDYLESTGALNLRYNSSLTPGNVSSYQIFAADPKAIDLCRIR